MAADSINVQHQVDKIQKSYKDFLKDLHKWEDEVQAKDECYLTLEAMLCRYGILNIYKAELTELLQII